MNMTEILKSAVERGASDIFVVAGLPLTYKVRGEQQRETADGAFTPEKTEAFAAEIYRLAAREPHCLNGGATDDDFSFSLSGTGRFRVNLFRQRGSIAAVVRVIRFGLPTAEEAHIPPEVMRAAQMKKGIVLVTGSAGSGKSTTLACIINEINRTRAGHILTLEDPVEYIHRHDKCIVSQREIGCDCPSYVAALRSALRESPDVILLGEMRDKETMEVAMTAAETFPEETLFRSLSRLILLLEEQLDTGGAPKASPIKCTETPTFELDILFRQNYSWQGRLRWTKGGKEAAFRSVLELLIQMETVLAQ